MPLPWWDGVALRLRLRLLSERPGEVAMPLSNRPESHSCSAPRGHPVWSWTRGPAVSHGHGDPRTCAWLRGYRAAGMLAAFPHTGAGPSLLWGRVGAAWGQTRWAACSRPRQGRGPWALSDEAWLPLPPWSSLPCPPLRGSEWWWLAQPTAACEVRATVPCRSHPLWLFLWGEADGRHLCSWAGGPGGPPSDLPCVLGWCLASQGLSRH